eukprot:Lithocolla_globosa_v1_NODE_910_length_3096_cov_8.230845.p4 type:complete len:114 gc:universal NODE_910_length_3096_cov_8.230845:2567-2908(+)
MQQPCQINTIEFKNLYIFEILYLFKLIDFLRLIVPRLQVEKNAKTEDPKRCSLQKVGKKSTEISVLLERLFFLESTISGNFFHPKFWFLRFLSLDFIKMSLPNRLAFFIGLCN